MMQSTHTRAVWHKRVLCFLLILMFSALSLCPAAGATASDTRQTIRVGFFAFDGYHMIDADGNRSGYGYDFLRMAARYMDADYTYVGYDCGWDDMLDMLADGRIDLVTSAQATQERLEAFSFSKPIGTSSAMLTVRTDNNAIVGGEYDTYDGIRIGLLEGNSRNEDLATFAKEKGFSYTPVYFSLASELAAARSMPHAPARFA